MALFLFYSFFIFFPFSAAQEKCFDQSEFCRYLKSFCNSTDHVSMMMIKCAATCGFCQTNKKTTVSDIILPPKMRSRQNISNETEPTASTPKKCVFPKEKMLTTASPENNTEYTFMANVSVVQKKDETIQTVLVQVTNSSRPKARIPSDSNEILKRLAQSKKGESLFQGESEEQKEEKEESIQRHERVMRKFKQSQLINENDIEMPRITTADPSKFSVSLAKTIIKGRCFDEYMYCSEFATLCVHPSFSDVMATHCTLTCNRCEDVDQEDEKDQANCTDVAPDCSKYLDVCHDERYLSLTRQYCSKTCGHCKPLCRDRHQNCAQFQVDGFCSDETYTVDERRWLCGASCGSC